MMNFFQTYLNRLRLGPAKQDISLLFFAVGIGILAAIGALLFRTLIEVMQIAFWPEGTSLVDQIRAAPWWQILLVPTLGGLVAGPVITFFVPEARGPGVPEVILAVTTRQSTIRHRVTFLKGLITSLLLACGASVGREGPIVQIGSSVGSSVAQLFDLSPELRRLCLACGAAAGISATFNAPISGAIFAMEIILLNIEMAYISHIVIASITGSVLSRIFWGDFPAFRVVDFQLESYLQIFGYLLLGLLAGLISIAFVRAIFAAENLFTRLPLPQWLCPALGGLLLGGMALQLPQVMGVGYDSVNSALSGNLPFQMALFLLIGKLAATSICIGSGMSGGIFAPSLYLGAVLGTIVGYTLSLLWPSLNVHPAFFALAGMGAVVSGTTLAPITAIVTIFELTLHPQIILPLMVSCISATLVVRLLFGVSAYELKLFRRGINIVRGHDVGILRNLCVKDFIRHTVPIIPLNASLSEIVQEVSSAPYPHFVVEDENQQLAGVLSLRDVRESLLYYEDLKDNVIAADIMTTHVTTITSQDTMATAMHLFEDHPYSMFPVVDDDNHVVGILTKDDLLKAYDQKVLKDRVLSARPETKDQDKSCRL
ncbi:MAG: chloride channel protein [Desulfovermiculus sp.]|nr:chloride channel protein [Desulfovermiculus sp.]